MIELGYWLSSEEHPPNDLIRSARRAEEVGFRSAMISDHYHPWIDRQGQAPFVWTVIGGIAHMTERLRLGTGGTCPIVRIHPAIIAQAAATAAAMMPGRFFLGVGTGERLNEHILGDHWPAAEVRLEMLAEAVEVIRLLWQGELREYYGRYFTVENARIYTLPETLPPTMVAASGRKAAELAGRIGDGLIGVTPDAMTVEAFSAAGVGGKPRLGQFKVCWARTEAEARRTAHEWWPMAGVTGEFITELAVPAQFEQVVELVSEEDVAREVLCGPDPAPHLARIRDFADAGYDHIYVHQVGPDQEGFFPFYKREILPALQKEALI